MAEEVGSRQLAVGSCLLPLPAQPGEGRGKPIGDAPGGGPAWLVVRLRQAPSRISLRARIDLPQAKLVGGDILLTAYCLLLK